MIIVPQRSYWPQRNHHLSFYALSVENEPLPVSTMASCPHHTWETGWHLKPPCVTSSLNVRSLFRSICLFIITPGFLLVPRNQSIGEGIASFYGTSFIWCHGGWYFIAFTYSHNSVSWIWSFYKRRSGSKRQNLAGTQEEEEPGFRPTSACFQRLCLSPISSNSLVFVTFLPITFAPKPDRADPD